MNKDKLFGKIKGFKKAKGAPHPELALELTSSPVKAVTRKLKTEWAIESKYSVTVGLDGHVTFMPSTSDPNPQTPPLLDVPYIFLNLYDHCMNDRTFSPEARQVAFIPTTDRTTFEKDPVSLDNVYFAYVYPIDYSDSKEFKQGDAIMFVDSGTPRKPKIVQATIMNVLRRRKAMR